MEGDAAFSPRRTKSSIYSSGLGALAAAFPVFLAAACPSAPTAASPRQLAYRTAPWIEVSDFSYFVGPQFPD